jgi:hypothetical protein
MVVDVTGGLEFDLSYLDLRQALNPRESIRRSPGRRRLEDDLGARELFERGERLRVEHPGITRPQVASRLNLPLSTYKRYVKTFGPKPQASP